MKTIIGIYVRIIYAIRAIKAINNPHLGDIVKYKGKDHYLIQGVANPYWDLIDMSDENWSKPIRDIERRVHVSNFKLQPLYKRFRYSFLHTYKFYMGSWFNSDVYYRHNKIKYHLFKIR